MPESACGLAHGLRRKLSGQRAELWHRQHPASGLFPSQPPQLANGRSLQALDHGPHERSGAAEPFHERGLDDPGEEGQHLVTDAIAEHARVEVALIVHPGDPAPAQIGLDLGPADVQQRTDVESAGACDAGEPAWPRALEQAHEHGLRLIVGGVGRGHPVSADSLGDVAKRTVACPARLRLQPFPGRPLPDHDTLHVERHAELGAKVTDERGISVGLRAKAMVDVDGVQRPGPLAGERMKHVEEGDRVRPSRDGGQDSFAAPEHLGAAKSGGDERRKVSDGDRSRPVVRPKPRRPRRIPSSRRAPSP